MSYLIIRGAVPEPVSSSRSDDRTLADLLAVAVDAGGSVGAPIRSALVLNVDPVAAYVGVPHCTFMPCPRRLFHGDAVCGRPLVPKVLLVSV